MVVEPVINGKIPRLLNVKIEGYVVRVGYALFTNKMSTEGPSKKVSRK